MPDVSSLGKSPKEEPELYPGFLPDHSYLLIGQQVLPLAPIEGERLGQWLVSRSTDPGVPLNRELSRLNATMVDRRTVVLAIGSNASPPQLVTKFGKNSNLVIPAVRGWAIGLGTAFSAHVNPAGYIPAAVQSTEDNNHRLRAWIVLPDDDQLRVIDLSEPNYERVVLARQDGQPIVELDSGEGLGACAIYRTKHGVLDLESSFPQGGLLPQRDLRALLAGIPDLARSDLVVDDGLDHRVVERKATYAQVDSSFNRPKN